MLLPQRPYLPSGTLKTAVTYPSVAGVYGDKAVRKALPLAGAGRYRC
jgi:putative ATP-binding cassette transporter